MHDSRYNELSTLPQPPAPSSVCYDAKPNLPEGAWHQNASMDSQEKNRLYQKGVEAFNSGLFYEAHEHWEEVWLQTANPDKIFLQGLIQVAAAFHHHSRDNFLGTRNLLRAGLLKLDCFPRIHGGLRIESLREVVRGWLDDLEAGEISGSRRLPRIGRHDHSGALICPHNSASGWDD